LRNEYVGSAEAELAATPAASAAIAIVLMNISPPKQSGVGDRIRVAPHGT